MPRTTKTPAYRLYKRTGQAVVALNGRDYYLGKHGTGASRQAYDRLIGGWVTGGRSLPTEDDPLTIIELVAEFWRHAERYCAIATWVFPVPTLPIRHTLKC